MLISVVSLGKSVASTSLATGIASVIHDRGVDVVLVELDPAGGDLAGRWGVPAAVGTAALAGSVAVANALSPALLDDVSVDAPMGFPVVCSPAGGSSALGGMCLALGDRYGDALSEGQTQVVVDGGRWVPDEPASGRVAGSAAVVALFTPDVSGVARMRESFEQLTQTVRSGVVIPVMVGENPYPAPEVSAALGVDVLVLPSEAKTVAAFMTGNANSKQSKRLKKSFWARSVARLVLEIEQATGQRIAPPVSEDDTTDSKPRRFSRRRKNAELDDSDLDLDESDPADSDAAEPVATKRRWFRRKKNATETDVPVLDLDELDAVTEPEVVAAADGGAAHNG